MNSFIRRFFILFLSAGIVSALHAQTPHQTPLQYQWDSVSGAGYGNTNNTTVNQMLNFRNTIYSGSYVNNNQVGSGQIFTSSTGDIGSWGLETELDSILAPNGSWSISALGSTNSGPGYVFAASSMNAASMLGLYRKIGNHWAPFGPGQLTDALSNYNQIDAITTFSMNGNGDSVFYAVSDYTLGAQIYASPVATDSFTLVFQFPSNLGAVGDMKVYNGKIYAAMQTSAFLYSSVDGRHWVDETVADNGFGDGNNSDYNKLEVYNGALYMAVTNYSNGAQLYVTYDGVSWSQLMNSGFGRGANVEHIDDMHAAYGQLWISTTYGMPSIQPKGIHPKGQHATHAPSGTSTFIYFTKDGSSFILADSTGFNNGDGNAQLSHLNHDIYVGAYNSNGSQVWRTCVSPSPVFNGPSAFCVNTPLTFSDTSSGITQYMWYLNGTLKDSLHSSYTYTPTATGSQTIKLVVFNHACADSLSQTFKVNGAVTMTLGGNKSLCLFDSITIKPTTIGGTTPYTYSWCIGSRTDSIRVAPLSQTTYTLQVTDQDGCAATDTSQITILQIPSAGISSSQYVCTSDTVIVGGSASGTVAPYTYSWNTGAHTDSIYVKILTNTTYTLTVHDANGCHAMDTLTVDVVAGPIITGTVTAPVSGVIASGKAYLINYNALPEKQFVVDTVPIIAGRYTFTHVNGGNYFVFAKANAATYPNVVKTYYPNVDDWINGTILSAPCQTHDTANIVMIELTPPTGNATFTGQVKQGSGYGHTHRPQPHNSSHQPGDPIPGLDVNLEQHPGGIMVAHDTTDAGGNYHFNNIPPGDYDVYVDIPGLGMISQYTCLATGANTFTQLNYVVDSSHIYKDSVLVTGIINTTPGTGQLAAYPNPFRDGLRIVYTLTESDQVYIGIYNLLGQEIIPVMNNHQESGDYDFSLNISPDQLPPGVYLLRMTVNGNSETRRLVRIR